MQPLHALVQRNIRRASFTLPFIDPGLRDMIGLIPSLLAEGQPSIGIYEHPPCTLRGYELLAKLLGRRPDIVVGRLHYRVMLESVIVLLRPGFTAPHYTELTLVCLARRDAPDFELTTKLYLLTSLFRDQGIPLETLVFKDTLPELLVYEIMRTGIVVAGKEPVTREDASSEKGFYIGGLPGIITQPAQGRASGSWNPFQTCLDSLVDRFVREGAYPSVLSVPSASPYLLPYLHILNHYEERSDAEEVEKIRTSLLACFSRFPPTAEVMKDLGRTWKMAPQNPARLGFTEALRLRSWLVPLERNELPVFCWPLPAGFERDRVELTVSDGLWCVQGAPEFRHAYAWVVLTWAAVSGLIGPATKVAAPRSLGMKRDGPALLQGTLDALGKGVELLVPHDPTQGSIAVKGGRFFFSPQPFAILEKGRKHSVELFEMVKKKTLIDDHGLSDKIKMR